MRKKIGAVWLASIVVGACLAPTASGSPVFTEAGKSVLFGTSVIGETTGSAILTGGFGLNCSIAELEGTVTKNSGTSITIEVPAWRIWFKGTGSGGDCTSALGDTAVTINSKLCFETVSGTDNVKITGCGANVTFTLKVTSAGISCAYSTASFTGTYSTGSTATANLTMQPASRESGQNIFCPASGNLTMDMDFWSFSGGPFEIS